MGIREKSKGTGTIRRIRFDKEFEHCPDCFHGCPTCWKLWKHKAHIKLPCYWKIFEECETCLTYPMWKQDWNNKGKLKK